MPRVIVFGLEDIGTNYRLLRHTKSFAAQPDSFVYLVGPCKSLIPRDVEELANVKILNFITFMSSSPILATILFPFRVILILLETLLILSKVGKIDFVLIQSEPFLMAFICGKFIRLIKKCKLIADIRPFRSVYNKSNGVLKKIETTLPKEADIRIVPTRSMQGYLQLKGTQSHIIRDNPGTLFKPYMFLREEVCSLLGIKKDTGIISIPFPFTNEQSISMVISILQHSDSLEVPLAFVVFGGGKSQQQLEERMKSLTLKNIKLSILPMYSDVYPQIMGACDLGIALAGARPILDVSPELIEMEWCCTPIAAMLSGCVREVVSDASGFFFKTEDELSDIIKKIFKEKQIDLTSMRESAKEKLVPWDESWMDAFRPYLDVLHQ